MNGTSLSAAISEWVEVVLRERKCVQTSPLEVVKQRPWASVWRMNTSAGQVYVKANAPGGAHEPALVRTLAAAWPDLVPAPLAVDEDRGWMLTADCGERMDAIGWQTDHSLKVWETLLPRYAELQIASLEHATRWLEIGVPDRRMSRLPSLIANLVDRTSELTCTERKAMQARIPELATLGEELGRSPAHAALDHGDLHEANLLSAGDRLWVIDWADACVSHAFVTLRVTREHALGGLDEETRARAFARLQAAYFEPWLAHASRAELNHWAMLANWAGTAARALDFDHMLQGRENSSDSENKEESGHWRIHVAAWLRRWLSEQPRDHAVCG